MTRGHVAVIGAGIVGVCCASYLQRAGYQVTIIDRGLPGEGCSFGNAGVIAPGACLPMAMPGIWKQIPRFLLDPLGPLAIRWRDFPRTIPWLIEWLRASSAERAREISSAMRLLHQSAFDCLEPLLVEAGASDLTSRSGQLYISGRNPAVLGEFSHSLLQAAGVKTVSLSAAQVRDLEPSITGAVGGLLFPEHGHSKNSFRIVQALAREILRRGGTIIEDEVRNFETSDGRVRALICSQKLIAADAVVIAAGAWSDKLAAKLGTKLQLIAERGYHITALNPGSIPSRPVSHMDHRVAITPMDIGVRVAGTVEIADVDSPPHPGRAKKLLALAKTVLPHAEFTQVTEWMGPRPSLPDGLPVIDGSPHFSNAFFSFGHSHYGLMGAAPTGRLLSELVAGSTPFVDPTPFALSRL